LFFSFSYGFYYCSSFTFFFFFLLYFPDVFFFFFSSIYEPDVLELTRLFGKGEIPFFLFLAAVISALFFFKTGEFFFSSYCVLGALSSPPFLP